MNDLTAHHKTAAPPARTYHDATGRPVQYLGLLLRRKWIRCLFALAGALFGALVVWRMPYVYQARALLEVQSINDNLLNRQELDPTAKSDSSSQSYVNTEAKLLRSTLLFDRVARQLNGGAPGAAVWTPPVTRQEIAASVRIVSHDTDRIVEVTADSKDPRRAAAIANTIGSEFIQQDLESRWQAGKNTSEWLARELNDLEGKLRASEEELQSFTRSSNLLIDDGQGSVAETRLRLLQDQLARAQDDRIAKESIYENIKSGKQTAAVTDGTVEQYEIQLTALEKQLAELEATYSPGYYKIPPLKAQIVSIEKSLNARRQVALDRLENDYRAAAHRERLLRAQYATQFTDTANDTAKIVRFNALKKAVEMNRNIYGEMLAKVKGYSVSSAMQTSNVRVADPAGVPQRPKRPNKPMIALLSSLGFLCGGIFWMVARAASNQNIAEPGDARHFLQSPELGVIPAAHSDPQARRAGIAGGRSLRLNGGSVRPGVETVTWKCSPSLMAESFRSTSASLLLPWKNQSAGRVFLVTSMSPAEGKTTVASNIAIAMAGAAGRVLLVDADRRRPRLHTVFERSNQRGLGELLLSSDPIEMAKDFVLDTPVPSLFLLPNGSAMLERPDLLYSTRMTELIKQWREDFDIVLIDTPPLLHLSDARIIGRLSDGVILVLRAGQARWESAMAAERRLCDDGIPILGTVLNGWHPEKDGYGVYPRNKAIYSYIAR